MGPQWTTPLSRCLHLFVILPSQANDSSGRLPCHLQSEGDAGRLANNASRKNAREKRGFTSLDDQRIHQKLSSSPAVQPSLGTEGDLPGPHSQVCEAE